MQGLSADLRTLLRGVPAQGAAVYVEDIRTGLAASVNPDQRFLSASIIKLAVMGAVYELWEKKPGLKTAQSRGWMDKMITVSDNASTDALVDMLGGPARVTAFCKERGWAGIKMSAKCTNLHPPGPNQVTAREVVALLAAVDRRKLISDGADEEMWGLLLRQTKRHRIPAGVPRLPGVEVGNKTGTINSVLHDSGIVHTPRTRYALCILLSHHRSVAAGDKFCARVSRLVFERLNGPVPSARAAAGEKL
jgi:beta-lactamase class A